MDNKLHLYNSILFLKLRPYINRNKPQSKYKELLKELTKEYYKFQPIYEVAFLKPPTIKAQYYRELINNESVRYFNHICSIVNDADDNEIKTTWVHSTLSSILIDSLMFVGNEIKRLDYSFSNIEHEFDHNAKNPVLSEESYIFQYLKVQLIQLYLDIQNAFKEYLYDEMLDEEDIYLRLFNEIAPNPSFLKQSKKIATPINTIKVKTEEKISFKPIYEDIHPIPNSIADYNIILNQQQFGEIESKLYDYNIIDIEYYFIKDKKSSNHTLLAAVYRVLIDNNYFRRNIIGTHKKLSDLNIRKYLDERYSTNTSQQFRRLTKEQIENAKIKLPWLDNIRRIS